MSKKQTQRELLNKEIINAESLEAFCWAPAIHDWFEVEEQKLIQALCEKYQSVAQIDTVESLVGQLAALRKLRRHVEDAGQRAAALTKKRAALDNE